MDEKVTIDKTPMTEPRPHARALPSRKKSWLLASASLLLIILFFLMPRNGRWMRERVLDYWSEFPAQVQNLDTEHRLRTRFKTHYTYAKSITDGLARETDPRSVLLLMPPTAYFRQKGIDFAVPEPAEFYYFTGLKTIWAHHQGAAAANWYVTVKGNIIQVDTVRDQKLLLQVIDSLKQYDPSL